MDKEAQTPMKNRAYKGFSTFMQGIYTQAA